MPDTIDRGTLLRASPALLAPSILATEAHASADPLPGLVQGFKVALAGFLAASEEPGGGGSDSPECLAFHAEMDRLRPLIINAVATSPEGIAAQIDFIRTDYEGSFLKSVGATVSDVPVALLENIAAGARRIGQ